MTVHIETETVFSKPGEPVTEDTRERLRARMRSMLDGAGVADGDKSEALEELEKLLGSDAGRNIDSLSAESIAVGLEKAADSLEPLEAGMVGLGFSLSTRGKGKQSFEMGETRGMLLAARGILSIAAANLRHAMGCDCHKDASESETIPPPAPGPEEAA